MDLTSDTRKKVMKTGRKEPVLEYKYFFNRDGDPADHYAKKSKHLELALIIWCFK